MNNVMILCCRRFGWRSSMPCWRKISKQQGRPGVSWQPAVRQFSGW